MLTVLLQGVSHTIFFFFHIFRITLNINILIRLRIYFFRMEYPRDFYRKTNLP